VTLELVTTTPLSIERGSNELTAPEPVESTDPDPVEVATREIAALRLRGAKNSMDIESEIGCWVEKVRNDSKYRDNWAETLAKRLHEPEKWLRRLSARSRVFPPDDTKSILERAQAKGFVIGPSHLDELVPVEDSALRRVLLDRCIEQSLTVKQLRSEIEVASPRVKASKRCKPLLAQGHVHLSALLKVVNQLNEERPVTSTQAERESFMEDYNKLSTAYGRLMEHWLPNPEEEAESQDDIDSGWDKEKE
jgi:hypothetical protein